MRLQPSPPTLSFLPILLFHLVLLGGACDGRYESILNDAAATSHAVTVPGAPDGGPATTTPDPGGESPLLLPSDDKCLDDGLTANEAQNLCQWGAGVLGPEGTLFQAACMDVVYDAGATSTPSRAMANMIVLSQATCASMIRSSYTGCPYTVGQFRSSVTGFHVGDCSGASLNILVGYKDMSLW